MENPGGEISISKDGGVPPYVPFGTFRNFLGKMTMRPPSRIDDSVMPATSRVLRLQLYAALRYLNLVSSEGAPTDRLKRLIRSQGAERKAVLRDTLKQAYGFLFSGFPLANCTSDELEQEFRKKGASGDTLRKCVAFFVGACREAGIETSAYIKPFRRCRLLTRKPPETKLGADSPDEDLKLTTGDLQGRSPDGNSSSDTDLLLQKFPNFDPKWPDELKSKWFDGLQSLLALLNERKSG
jgi:hypothetical protein